VATPVVFPATWLARGRERVDLRVAPQGGSRSDTSRRFVLEKGAPTRSPPGHSAARGGDGAGGMRGEGRRRDDFCVVASG